MMAPGGGLYNANLDPSRPPVQQQHSQGALYSCTEGGCNKTFNHKSSWTAHMKKHTRTGVKPEPSSSSSSSGAIHKCPECEKTYKSQGGLYWHQQTVHKKRVFSCNTCNKQYKSYPGYYLHSKTHLYGTVPVAGGGQGIIRYKTLAERRQLIE